MAGFKHELILVNKKIFVDVKRDKKDVERVGKEEEGLEMEGSELLGDELKRKMDEEEKKVPGDGKGIVKAVDTIRPKREIDKASGRQTHKKA